MAIFKNLSGLLNLNEEDGITAGIGKSLDGIKKGHKSAMDRHKSAIDKRKEVEKEIEKKQAAAEKAAKDAVNAEKKITAKTEKEAELAALAAQAEHQLKSAESMKELRSNLNTYLTQFFDQYPLTQGKDKILGSADDIIDKYPTREAAAEALKIYGGLADRLESLIKGFNTALVQQNKIPKRKVDQYYRQAMRTKREDPVIPGPLVSFVRKEAKFFKRLIRIDDNFKLDAEDFKDLLSAKMKMTPAERTGDAAQALNLLFFHLAGQLQQQKTKIQDHVLGLDDKEGASKAAAHAAAAAKHAAETEADAKASEPKVRPNVRPTERPRVRAGANTGPDGMPGPNPAWRKSA
jgi:molecular chaperone GrpE (heat shock protein)